MKRYCINCNKDISNYHPRQLYCWDVVCQNKKRCEQMKRYYKNKRLKRNGIDETEKFRGK